MRRSSPVDARACSSAAASLRKASGVARARRTPAAARRATKCADRARTTTSRAIPLCQLLSLAKHANPEVLVHLSDANAALLAAVRAILEARDRAGAGQRPGGLEHIEIS